MSDVLYRRNAAACYELARAATNEDEKVRWIVLAQDWLERADAWQASDDQSTTEQVCQQQVQPKKKETDAQPDHATSAPTWRPSRTPRPAATATPAYEEKILGRGNKAPTSD
jgi:hypothetical protein